MSRFRGLAFVLSFASATAAYAQQPVAPYDPIFSHGQIIDGTRSPWYRGVAARDRNFTAIKDFAQDSDRWLSRTAESSRCWETPSSPSSSTRVCARELTASIQNLYVGHAIRSQDLR